MDIDMERAGTHLHIPRDEWENPAVQEPVGCIVRVDELQQDRFAAVGARAHEQLPRFLDGTHALPTRYATAEQFLRVIAALLREGLGVWERRQESASANFHELEEKLANALQPYGLAATTRS